MKKYIHSAKQLPSMDPFELKQAGYKVVDTGYAETRTELQQIQYNLQLKYPKLRLYQVKTDTPGLLMYEAFAPIEE